MSVLLLTYQHNSGYNDIAGVRFPSNNRISSSNVNTLSNNANTTTASNASFASSNIVSSDNVYAHAINTTNNNDRVDVGKPVSSSNFNWPYSY